jgi:uncharacterized tellurite resistance protein B-like protein
MSLANDLDEFFAESKEVVVTEPLKFKAKLGIGERAYALLRAREHMTTFSEAIGIGATGSAVAASGAVASTFFASSGFMATTLSAIGLGATAVTPIGWVIAAGVISGGAYVGVSQLFEKSKDNGLIVVPKYINTPLDVISVALIELMLPVSLKMANAGGGIQISELEAIQRFFSEEWGYNSGFVSRLTDEYRTQTDSVSYSKLAGSLGTYCAESKDCDKEAIMTGFIEHLREVIEADGVIHEQEKLELDYLTDLLITESEKAGGSSTVTNALSAASKGLSHSTKIAAGVASSVGSVTLSGLSKGTGYVTGTGKVAVENTSNLANKSTEIASAGFDSGKKYASAARETTSKTAKSLWNSLSKKVKGNDKDGMEH